MIIHKSPYWAHINGGGKFGVFEDQFMSGYTRKILNVDFSLVLSSSVDDTI